MNIGYIGFGQMGSAIAEGLKTYGGAALTQYAWAPHAQKLQKRAAELGAHPCRSAQEVVDQSELVILACKPYQVEDALRGVELRGRALVSIVNKWGFADFKKLVGESARVQCIMPNTPVKVGRGTILIAQENDLRADEREALMRLLATAATLVELPEEKIPARSRTRSARPAAPPSAAWRRWRTRVCAARSFARWTPR